ncbi:MAG: dehydrogenase [Cyclobacteriaceae bacterium]|nr:dehydrogenase [Cyclobacteriaceae bacterium]
MKGKINKEGFKIIGLSLFKRFFLVNFVLFCLSCRISEDNIPSEPRPIQSPEEEQTSFQIPSGLKIQLVAHEPMVQDPVVIKFDEDGRLWVVEMRGFMPDMEGTGERNPVGRVSILEDTDIDGRMDKSTIFLDSLVLPRALAIVKRGALVAANEALWFASDKNGDSIADTLILIDKDYAGNSMIEHSGNGLWRGVDNWYYNAKSKFRYKQIDGEWKKDATEFRGQWGMSHDDEGRLIYNYNWSQLHADLVPPNYLSENPNHSPSTGIDHGLTIDRRVYPIRDNPAINRGYIPGVLDEKGRLKEFTAACSPFSYRARTLPSEYYGNVFVCEPSGNLVKRNIVKENGFMLYAFDPTPREEFLASDDERFRPVSFASGPDGALYIADMYRGQVQHGVYGTPYLKEQTLKRKLDSPINLGRIWRVVPEDWSPSQTPDLSQENSKKLVDNLSSENGWMRDISQRLLIERNEPQINQELLDLILNGKNHLGVFHALWTLEGREALNPELLIQLLDDNNIQIKTTALRLLEPFAADDVGVRLKMEAKILLGWTDPKEMLQLALSSRVLAKDVSFGIFMEMLEVRDTTGVLRDAILSSLHKREFGFLENIFQSPKWQEQNTEKEIFLDALTASVLKNKNNAEAEALLSLLDISKELFGWKEKIILDGLSISAMGKDFEPIKLSRLPAIINRVDLIETEQIKLIKSIFEWPGHKAIQFVQSNNKLVEEKDQQQFILGRQKYLTTCAGCHGTNGAGMKRLGPPLANSDWVLGDEVRLMLIVLHGIEGPIKVNDKLYDAPEILPIMPSHSTMDDGSIASILTYIRNEWGNSALPISGRTVSKIRISSQGNVLPWTASGLNAHIDKINKSREISP